MTRRPDGAGPGGKPDKIMAAPHDLSSLAGSWRLQDAPGGSVEQRRAPSAHHAPGGALGGGAPGGSGAAGGGAPGVGALGGGGGGFDGGLGAALGGGGLAAAGCLAVLGGPGKGGRRLGCPLSGDQLTERLGRRLPSGAS